jgi:ribosomal protein S8
MINPFPDTVSRMKVALRRKRQDVVVLNSNFVKSALLKYFQLGYVSSFNILDFKKLLILLKYMFGDSVISTLINFFRLSNRLYMKLFHIHAAMMRSVISSVSHFLFSTSYGILTDAECRMLHAGGYLICIIG